MLRKGHYSVDQLNKDKDYLTQFQSHNSTMIEPVQINHLNLKLESQRLKDLHKKELLGGSETSNVSLADYSFSHLHNHSQYSVLQSTTQISKMVDNLAQFQGHLIDSKSLLLMFK